MTQSQTDALVRCLRDAINRRVCHFVDDYITDREALIADILAALRRTPDPVPVAGEVRDKVALMICAWDNDGLASAGIVGSKPFFDHWLTEKPEYYELADAILAALSTSSVQPEREGFVLVPREPTEAMVQAVTDMLNHTKRYNEAKPREVWSAMLAASPLPSDQGEG